MNDENEQPVYEPATGTQGLGPGEPEGGPAAGTQGIDTGGGDGSLTNEPFAGSGTNPFDTSYETGGVVNTTGGQPPSGTGTPAARGTGGGQAWSGAGTNTGKTESYSGPLQGEPVQARTGTVTKGPAAGTGTGATGAGGMTELVGAESADARANPEQNFNQQGIVPPENTQPPQQGANPASGAANVPTETGTT